jgi:hypothetical protein
VYYKRERTIFLRGPKTFGSPFTDIASKIVALRPAIEALIIRSTQEPNQVINRPQPVEQLCNLIRLLSDQQLEHVLCEKINENNDTRQPENSNFR